MEKETSHKRVELLKWTVSEFYFEFMYIAWEKHIAKKYSGILKDTKTDE